MRLGAFGPIYTIGKNLTLREINISSIILFEKLEVLTFGSCSVKSKQNNQNSSK